MEPLTEAPKRSQRRAALAGCLTVGLVVPLLLLVFLMAAPFIPVRVRGVFVTGRVTPRFRPAIPHGLSQHATIASGNLAEVWVLRVGDSFWAVQLPRR